MTIGDSGSLTSSTLASQPFANIYNLINDRSNVEDPNDDTGERKFVYQRFPKITSNNTPGYPFIVVKRARPAKAKGMLSSTKSFMDFNFMITVYTRDKNSDSAGDPNAAETCDNITNAIIATLNSSTNRRTLRDHGMSKVEFDIDTDEDEDLEGNYIFMSEFDVRFVNNLTATS